jgi:sugar (pentulose or hexulose) kinase
MKKRTLMAFDLGASSGRGILAAFDGNRIELNEAARFPNSPSFLHGRAYWNFLWIMDNIKKGMASCNVKPESIGIDTWGVDFGLLDGSGGLLSMPRSYRDNAFDRKNMEEAAVVLGGERELFFETYLSNWEINPLFKLYYMKKNGEEMLESAKTFLMLPNLIEYFLTGRKHSEYTICATTQLYNMKQKKWAGSLMDKIGIPQELFTEVDYAGKILGPLSRETAEETGCKAQIISVAGHDTASAALAAPSSSRKFTFISSGTWSLLCSCSSSLLEDENVMKKGISNEANWDGSYRSTVSISGLWILQECRRQWAEAGLVYSYDELDSMAERERPLQSFVRPDDFVKISDYPQMICEFCLKTGQYVPEGTGQIVRCILESLALKYRQARDLLRPHTCEMDTVYVVGGGARNRMLNQFTANALDTPVVTGTSEATAVGNLLIQMEALGELRGDDQRSEIIKNSFKSEVFLPHDREVWDDAYGRFLGLYNKIP